MMIHCRERRPSLRGRLGGGGRLGRFRWFGGFGRFGGRLREFAYLTINGLAAVAEGVHRRDGETDALANRNFRVAEEAGGCFLSS